VQPDERNVMARAPRFRLVSAATLLLCLTGASGQALDQLDFQVAGGDKAMESDLQAASGLLADQQVQGTGVLDLFTDARAEYAKLIGVLYGKGHYSPVIHVLIDGREAADIAPLDAPVDINRIVVTVDPGPTFTFGTASVTPLTGKTVLPPGFATGKVAESGQVQQAVRMGLEGWRAEGYAKAKVAGKDLVANHADSTLNALIDIEKGPRLRFGALTVQGTERMSAARARAIAGLSEGAQFESAAKDRSAQRLRRSGVFSSVTLVEDDTITAPDLLGITAELVEAPLRRFTFGAEVASADGAKVTGSWLHRNLLGGGERLEITGEVAGIAAQTGGSDYTLDVTLDRPATPFPDTELNLDISISQVNEVDTTARIFNMSAGFTQYFSDSLTSRAALGFAATDGTDAAGHYSYQALELPIRFTWDRRDSKTDATELFYLDGEAKPFYGLTETDNGVRLSFDGRVYKGLGDNRVVMAARLQGGAILGADILSTPRNDLFYSGGGGTVRGQVYQSLGVTVTEDGVDIPTGGNDFLAGSLEARVKVTQTVGLVGFFDIGLVGQRGESSDWHAGAGLGVRYATSVGPVRLDVALPVHSGSGMQVYVGLGQAF